MAKKLTYYLLDEHGRYVEQYTCYSDIAFEHGVTRNSVAGKFYRALRKNHNIININGNSIKRVILSY